MATESTSIGDKPLKIFYENSWHEFIIRVPEGSPSLSIPVMNNLVRETLKTWMYAWRGVKGEMDTQDLKSADENLDITPSGNEPYVTIFNKDWDGLSITVHDNSKPQTAVNLVTAYREAIAIVQGKLPSLFNPSEFDQMGDFGMPKKPKQADKLDPDTYFGGKPENKAPIPFPTDNAARGDSSETVSFRASREADGNYMIESGKPESSAWKDVTRAQRPYDASKINYGLDELVAFMVNAPMVVKSPKDNLCMEVPTSGGKFTFWRNKRNSQEQTFDWQSIEKQLYGVNILSDSLVDGFQLDMPCLLIVKFTRSQDGLREFANFYGFRALPKQAQKAS